MGKRCQKDRQGPHVTEVEAKKSKANGHRVGRVKAEPKELRLGQMDKNKGGFYFQIGLQNINICRACSFGGNQARGV